MKARYKLEPSIFERIWLRIRRIFTKQYYVKTNNIYHEPQFTISVMLDGKLFWMTYEDGTTEEKLFGEKIRMYWGGTEGQDIENPQGYGEGQLAMMKVWGRKLTKEELKQIEYETNLMKPGK